MACLCECCKSPADCGERLCIRCFLDTLDNVEKNIYLGGHFYEEKEDKEDNKSSADATT